MYKAKQKMLKRHIFLDFQQNIRNVTVNNKYCRPNVLGQKTILNQICCPLCNY